MHIVGVLWQVQTIKESAHFSWFDVFVLFLVPALKYPANPPAVGNPATIYYRESLFIGFIAVSGFSTLGLALLYRKLENNQQRKIGIPLIILLIMIGAYLVFPPNPDKITIPMDLIMRFRIASVFTTSIFWGLLGIILEHSGTNSNHTR